MAIRVVGTHCYLGGFLIGIQKAGLEVRATAETWKRGAEAAAVLGLPVTTLEKAKSHGPDADMNEQYQQQKFRSKV